MRQIQCEYTTRFIIEGIYHTLPVKSGWTRRVSSDLTGRFLWYFSSIFNQSVFFFYCIHFLWRIKSIIKKYILCDLRTRVICASTCWKNILSGTGKLKINAKRYFNAFGYDLSSIKYLVWFVLWSSSRKTCLLLLSLTMKRKKNYFIFGFINIYASFHIKTSIK